MAKSTNSYRSLISKDEKTQQKEQIDMQVSAARVATESALHSAKTELIAAKGQLKKSLSATDFSVAAVLQAQDSVAAAEEAVSRIKGLRTELFGGEAED